MGIRDSLLAEYDHEVAATRRMLACIPGDRLTWRPHERSRTLGALAGHIVDITSWSGPILERPRFDLDDAPPPSAEPDSLTALLGRFGEEAARARARLDRNEAELAAPWCLLQGGQELFTLPRAAAFRNFVLGHVAHHRGQLSVYLRLNDITVPPMYGPTADFRGKEKSEVRGEN